MSAEGTLSKRVADSICQDIVYNTVRGEIKTVEHNQLAHGVKRKPDSKKIIEWLNRFDHCISYPKVNAAKNKLAMDESYRSRDRTVYIPISYYTVNSIWNNCTYTNGIIVQTQGDFWDNGQVELTHESVSTTDQPKMLLALKPTQTMK